MHFIDSLYIITKLSCLLTERKKIPILAISTTDFPMYLQQKFCYTLCRIAIHMKIVTCLNVDMDTAKHQGTAEIEPKLQSCLNKQSIVEKCSTVFLYFFYSRNSLERNVLRDQQLKDKKSTYLEFQICLKNITRLKNILVISDLISRAHACKHGLQ